MILCILRDWYLL